MLPGLPQTDPEAATRSALLDPLVALMTKHDPNTVLRTLQRVVVEARRRLPEERKPKPYGVLPDDAPVDDKYRATPDAIVAAGDALARVYLAELDREAEGPLQHKAVLLHGMIVQAINATMRATDGMSPEAYISGIANAVAQMLAITHSDACYADFMDYFPKVWARMRVAGQGAGVDMTPKGSA